MPLDFARLTRRAVLGPLAGYTDSVFRGLCRREGAAFVVTEMVSADGVVRNSAKTLELAAFQETERPVVIQLFGSQPDVMAEAARRVSELRPDGIDLNFGCPTPKIVKKGAGAALLKDLKKLEAIARAVVEASPVPVTAKIRSGWGKDDIVAVDAVRCLEQAGVAAVTLHPRTRHQRFSGKADWSLIRAAKRAVRIPVIGNGDIWQARDAIRMFEETGCDLVMVARGALGRPFIFRQIHALLEGVAPFEPQFHTIIDLALEHLHLSVEKYGEHRGFVLMKRHLAHYVKGLPGASEIKNRLFRATEAATAESILREYRQALEGEPWARAAV